MGGGASVSSDVLKERKSRLAEGGLSNTFRKMQLEGMDDTEIYHRLRETYGSMRVSKKLTVNEGSVRALAIIQLSQTLETNRVKLDDGGSMKSSIASTSKKYSHKSHDFDLNSTSDELLTKTTPPKPVAAATSAKSKKPKLKIVVAADDDDGLYDHEEHPRHPPKQITPRDNARLNPSGSAVHIGDFEIHEKGIQPKDGVGTSFLTAGRSDFVMIGSLGRGASGSVIEALHIPTLTIVALKMLPIYDADDLHHIASEMSVLYQNLAELKLIDNRLDDVNEAGFFELSPKPETAVINALMQRDGDVLDLPPTPKAAAPSVVVSRCKQVLAMYDGKRDTLLCISTQGNIIRFNIYLH
jgi:hypothetical protein